MKRFTLFLLAALLFSSAASAAPDQGLYYCYYEGSWTAMPDFGAVKPVKAGASNNLDLSVRSRDLNYAILWQGFITIPAGGTYTFETNSDDGSMLYIAGLATPLVNNDGVHPNQLRQASLYLAAGVYPINISFFQNGGGQTMEVYWSSTTGITRQRIPDAAFSYTSGATFSSLSPGLNYSYYEASWTAMPDFTALKAVKAGTSANLDLGVRSRDINYAILWQGFITIPAGGTYTFQTNSDDGSMLYIAGSATPLVNNDGLHPDQLRSGSLYLAAGVYPVNISFFQNGGGQTMELYWSSTAGISRQRIPDNAFTHTATATTVTTTNTTPGTVASSTETGGLSASINYYFSTSTGDDSRSAAQAQNPATPWKSVARMNAILSNATPGTALLLKRGDAFDGALYVTSSGAAGNPIIISAYGTGPKPVINGFASQPAWTFAGNGIWEAPLATTLARINLVAKDNQIQPMGRYPNITDAAMGFLSIDAHSNASSSRNTFSDLYSYLNADGSTSIQSITDAQLPASPNWTGAEVVIKKNRWVLDRGLITSHSGNTLSYVEPSGMQPIDGFGYFIQNDPRTLDQVGEWYFNPATRKIQVYAGSVSPATWNIRPSVIDTLVTIRSRSYITLDNLAVQGANSIAIAVWDNANGCSVQNCLVDFTGNTAIKSNWLTGLSITGTTVNHTCNTAMYLAPACWNTTVKNNTIRNAGMTPGLGQSGDQAHEGIIIGGAGSVLQYNSLDSIGYVGIAITRDSVTVINNFVNNFAMITDDCGGIYTHDKGYMGRRILGNIVLNGHGCHYGTSYSEDTDAQGIGLDDLSSFVEIAGNTVANCSGKGIGLHNSQNITITGNTAFNNKTAQLEFDHDMLAPESPTRGVVAQNNILVSRTAAQPVLAIASKDDDIALFGTANGNYYCRPLDDKQTFQLQPFNTTAAGYTRLYDLQHWRTAFGVDAGSRRSPVSIAGYSYSGVSANLVSGGSFDQGIKGMQTPTAYHTQLQYDGYGAGLDGGAVKVVFTGSSQDQYQSAQFYDAATPDLQGGHTYRVRFSVRAAVDNNTDFYCSLLSAYGQGRTEAKLVKVSGSRSEVELLFTAGQSVVHPYFELYSQASAECPVYWMDNLSVQEVYGMAATNPDDYFRFEYNAGTGNKVVSLDGEYMDMKGNVYASSITLGAYSSAVLVRKGAAGLAMADASAGVAAGSAAVTEKVVAAGMSVRVSPNPATDHIELSHTLEVGTQGSVVVYNAAGVVVKRERVSISSAAVGLEVGELKAGVYTVKLESGRSSNTARFVKM